MAKSPSDSPSLAVRWLCAAVGAYQWFSAGRWPRCRFTPSCSRYLQDALRVYGIWKGCWKGTLRVLRCHPWHPGGWDPVR